MASEKNSALTHMGSRKNFVNEEPVQILGIEQEPAPYKTDRWNTFSNSSEAEVFVVYTERKNWAPDGGHNYLKFPEKK